MGILSIIVDSREPDWAQKLTFGGTSVAVCALEAGDLFCATDDGCILAIERKTATDFLNTLRDDRLFPQLVKLRETSPWAYLVICGELRPGPAGKCWADSRETGWNWSSVSGALLTVQEIGVNILQVASDHDYEQAIIRLANRDRKDLNVRPPRDATLVSDAESILTAFPGIGHEKVDAILKYCGTPAWALAFLTDDSLGQNWVIQGIGEATKRKIRKALGLPDWAVLAIVSKETGNPPEQEQLKQEDIPA